MRFDALRYILPPVPFPIARVERVLVIISRSLLRVIFPPWVFAEVDRFSVRIPPLLVVVRSKFPPWVIISPVSKFTPVITIAAPEVWRVFPEFIVKLPLPDLSASAVKVKVPVVAGKFNLLSVRLPILILFFASINTFAVRARFSKVCWDRLIFSWVLS